MVTIRLEDPRSDAERDGEVRLLVGYPDGELRTACEFAGDDEHAPPSDYVGAEAGSQTARD